MSEEIEKMLSLEQREQKRTASGIRGRASRLGRIGAMRTAFDFMDKKTKKEYTKSSEVRVYSMYQDRIYSWEEFKALSTKEQRAALDYWRRNYPTKDIKEAWIIKGKPISTGRFYGVVTKGH